MLDSIIALVVLSAVGFYGYVTGKQVGSRKGFGVGRYGRK
jgi:hypothetical protein